VDLTDVVEITDSSDDDLSRIATTTPLFPNSHRRTTRVAYTQVGDGNLVDGFVSATLLSTQESDRVSLTARNEHIAASAMFNTILKMACVKFKCRMRVDNLDESLYSWHPHEPTDLGTFFKQDFSLFL
jgi:hypothetical protein